MSAVLVTGSEGFLGRHICPALVAAGWQTWGLDLPPAPDQPGLAGYHSLRLPSAALDEVLQAVKPAAIVHAAGPASVGASLQDPAGDFAGSVGTLMSLLDAVRRNAPACRVVFLSSAAVYGDPAGLPVREDAPHRPLSPYGYHKSLAERLLQEFWAMYGLPSVTLRLFSAYGPGLRRQVMWDICQKALHLPEIELFGTGDESRDFVHAGDIAQAVPLVLARAAFEAEAYNLASGTETRISDLADRITTALGRGTRVRFSGAARAGDPQRWQADLTRIRALGYEPGVPLAEGVANYARWAASVAE